MKKKAGIWSTGLAMFAMFFGAGNIVFPLALGQYAQDKSLFGVSGLILTAVFVPLMGVLAMVLYNGDYTAFFRRIGKVPGLILTVMILGLIGPFGGIPRCMIISYSTLNAFGIGEIQGVSLLTFSAVSSVVIFLFAFRPNKVLTLLGNVLTPALLLALIIIIIKGLFKMPSSESSTFTSWHAFSQGIKEGYNTMDLLGSFFFSSIALACLRKGQISKDLSGDKNRNLMKIAFFGSVIAAILLVVIYLSFSLLSAGFSQELASVGSDEMLGTLAYHLLGPYAGILASVAVSFACLTTEIALTVAFAQFLHKVFFKGKFSYQVSLVITLVTAFFVSTLHFEGITAFLVPTLQLCYPALIVLCIFNILYKLYGFQRIKPMFYGTLVFTFLSQLF